MANIPVFWMEPSGRVQVRLRVYHSSAGQPCSGGRSYCDGVAVLHEDVPEREWREEYSDPDSGRLVHRTLSHRVAKEDPRWPTRCDGCGREFPADATRQVWADRLYAGAPDGKLYNERSLPVGALRNAEWLTGLPGFTGADGIALQCITPGGEWMVDSEASNCTRKGDRSHKCWIRHGDPRDPQGQQAGRPLHVDKDGDTCSAGAGSIQCGSYHGFLHNGQLTSC